MKHFKDKEFKTIYADPPWAESGGGKIKRGADRHYSLMKTKDIIALEGEVKRVSADNAHLYLWATNNFLPDALKVMDAWGFRYVTNIAWVKPGRMGLGQYFRGCHELCLFGVKGMVPYKVVDGKRQQGRSTFQEARRLHSQKPFQMRRMIEKVSYPPYLELFARESLKGWKAWGNQVSSGMQETLSVKKGGEV